MHGEDDCQFGEVQEGCGRLTLEPPPTLGKESKEEEEVLDGTEESDSAKDLSGAEEELRRRMNLMTLEEESENEELGAWRRSPVAQRVWEGGVVT